MPHEFTQVSLVCLQNEVKVVGHQDITYDSDVIDLGAVLQCTEKCSSVSIGDKNILFAITAIHHMVIGPGVLYSERSGHRS
jgi:hypothetical protein